MTGTNLTGVKLPRTNFSDAKLTQVILIDAELYEAIFENTDLSKAVLIGVDFTGAKVKDVVFRNANMTQVNMRKIQLEKCDFRGANLTEADLTGADLTDADLTGANLTGADLTGANLTRTNLTGTNLTGANLTGARLTEVNLTEVNLTGANLSGTILSETVRNAIITNVGLNFKNVNLEGVKLIPEITNVYRNKVYTNKGYNPVTRETENITEWLKNKTNLVFIIDDNKTPMCLNRDVFNLNTIQLNYILYQCDINDNKFVKKSKKTFYNKFLDLSKYNMIENTVVNCEDFFGTIVKNENDQIFVITTKSNLQPIALFNDEAIVNVNMFNKTFTNYSENILYKNITRHLITGEKTTSDVMKHISNMDQCFMEYAEVTEDDKMILYRGMDSPYNIGMGESMIVSNYISTTTSVDEDNRTVSQFINYDYYKDSKNKEKKPKLLPNDVNNCCAYELEIDKDIPYVDMKFSTLIPSEKEILLPRNLLITLIREYITGDDIHMRVLRVSKSTEDQFENIHKKKCSNFQQANITAINVKFSNGTGGSKFTRKTQKKTKTKTIANAKKIYIQ